MLWLVLNLALAALAYLLFGPRPKTNAEEERDFREFYRKKDAADRRGERYPP